MDFAELREYKTVLVLVCVLVLNVVVMFLLLGLDSFVHGDLYGYGLVFSYNWANLYWHNSLMLWTCVGGATVLAAASIVPHYLHSNGPSRFSKWTGFLLSTLAMVYQGVGIFFFSQINSLVWSGLYDYGLQGDIDWTTTYNPISTPILTLMVVAFLALIIPAVRTLEIIKIEIVDEDE